MLPSPSNNLRSPSFHFATLQPSPFLLLRELSFENSTRTRQTLMEKKWIHVVVWGRQVGLFSSWDEYCKDVLTYSHSIYKKCRTAQEVRDYIASKLDIGDVELRHIQVMVDLIRQLTPDNPYVPKTKVGTNAKFGAPSFPNAGVKWEAGQSSSNAHPFERADTFLGLSKAESMQSKVEDKFFKAYTSGPNCFEKTASLAAIHCWVCSAVFALLSCS